MKVKFKTRSSGPEGTIYPGQVVEVPESEARMLAEGGYAVLLEQSAPTETEQAAPTETEQTAEKTEPKADNRQKPERKRG